MTGTGWGHRTAGTPPPGPLTSSPFALSGTGQVSFLLSGGNDATNLYVALVHASDGAILRRATGRDEETYHRVTWDASAHIGQTLHLRAVDTLLFYDTAAGNLSSLYGNLGVQGGPLNLAGENLRARHLPGQVDGRGVRQRAPRHHQPRLPVPRRLPRPPALGRGWQMDPAYS